MLLSLLISLAGATQDSEILKRLNGMTLSGLREQASIYEIPYYEEMTEEYLKKILLDKMSPAHGATTKVTPPPSQPPVATAHVNPGDAFDPEAAAEAILRTDAYRKEYEDLVENVGVNWKRDLPRQTDHVKDMLAPHFAGKQDVENLIKALEDKVTALEKALEEKNKKNPSGENLGAADTIKMARLSAEYHALGSTDDADPGVQDFKAKARKTRAGRTFLRALEEENKHMGEIEKIGNELAAAKVRLANASVITSLDVKFQQAVDAANVQLIAAQKELDSKKEEYKKLLAEKEKSDHYALSLIVGKQLDGIAKNQKFEGSDDEFKGMISLIKGLKLSDEDNGARSTFLKTQPGKTYPTKMAGFAGTLKAEIEKQYPKVDKFDESKLNDFGDGKQYGQDTLSATVNTAKGALSKAEKELRDAEEAAKPKNLGDLRKTVEDLELALKAANREAGDETESDSDEPLDLTSSPPAVVVTGAPPAPAPAPAP